MSIKMIDIARHVNLSPATISRVIHNSGYVSAENRQKVQQALKELSYVPNRIAQGLRKQKTKMIGHILPRPYPNPFYSEISRGVDLGAYENDYHVLTLSSYRDPKRESMLIDDLLSRMVDGIIFTNTISVANIEKVKNLGMHVVAVDRMADVPGIDKVLVDHLEGSFLAAQYLMHNNHEKIAYFGVKCINNVEIQLLESQLQYFYGNLILNTSSSIF